MKADRPNPSRWAQAERIRKELEKKEKQEAGALTFPEPFGRPDRLCGSPQFCVGQTQPPAQVATQEENRLAIERLGSSSC